MPFKQILLEVAEDGIALLTINRPQKLNALNMETVGELDQAFDQFEHDPAMRALLLTGAGDRAFVAGADINEFVGQQPVEALELSLRGQRLFRRLELCGKPSVAAVNGFALGGGLELAMACTMRVCVPEAKLGQPEVKLGIIAGYGGTQRLPRLVGRGKGLEMLVTGEPVDGVEAHRIGLANHLVPREQLLDFSRGLLRKVLANAPVAVALTMQAVDSGLSAGPEAGFRFEATAFAVTAGTEDRAEGTRAFLEKRPPVFRGR